MPRRRRASEPIDESTWQGRLRKVAVDSEVDADTVASKLGKASSVTIYEWERPNNRKSPNPDELATLIRAYGADAGYVLMGEASKRSTPDLVAQLTSIAESLEPADQRALIALAQHFLGARQHTEEEPVLEEPGGVPQRDAPAQQAQPRRSRATQ